MVFRKDPQRKKASSIPISASERAAGAQSAAAHLLPHVCHLALHLGAVSGHLAYAEAVDLAAEQEGMEVSSGGIPGIKKQVTNNIHRDL